MEYTNRRNANEYGLFALMGVVHPTDSVVSQLALPIGAQSLVCAAGADAELEHLV
jgi:hypothetical protein